MTQVQLQETPGGVRLSVRVKPKASRSQVLSVANGKLAVAVAAPPVEGEANRELCRVLARHFGLPRSQVTVCSGLRSRNKVVELLGCTSQDVLAKLAPV